jgi:hypothetical protein
MSKFQKILKAVTDILAVLFPAAMEIFGLLHLTNLLPILNTAEAVTFVIVGLVGSIANIIALRMAAF